VQLPTHQQLAKGAENFRRQRLGEDVCPVEVGGDFNNVESPRTNLVSKMMPLDRKMMGAWSGKGHGVSGKFKAGLIVFMGNRLELVSGNVALSLGKSGHTMRFKEPLGEFVKDMAKQDKHSSTHG